MDKDKIERLKNLAVADGLDEKEIRFVLFLNRVLENKKKEFIQELVHDLIEEIEKKDK